MAAGEMGQAARDLTPADKSGAVVWLYCCTDTKRRVVKVGISKNVPARAGALRSELMAKVLRSAFGLVVSPMKDSLRVARTWSLGDRTKSEAMNIESEVHAALRECVDEFYGEWFHCSPSKAIPVIARVLERRGCCEAA